MFRYILGMIFLISSVWFNTSFAALGQLSDDPYMINPAELAFKVMKIEYQAGFIMINARMRFTGTGLGDTALAGTPASVYGIAKARPVDFYPFGSLAMRATDKMVFAFTATPVLIGHVKWPRQSIIQNSGTELDFTAWNFSPKMSYQICPNLAVGAGFDALFLVDKKLDRHPDLSSVGFGPDLGKYHLDGGHGGWRYTYDLGISYGFRPTCVPQLPYMSVLSLKYMGQAADKDATHGHTTYAGMQTTPTINSNFAPSVTLTYFHVLNKEWLFRGMLQWTGWSTLKNINFRNISDPAVVQPFSGPGGTGVYPTIGGDKLSISNFRNVWAYSFLARRALGLAAGVSAGINYETWGIPIQTRTSAYPEGAAGTVFFGLDSYLSKELSAVLTYSYSRFMPNHLQISYTDSGEVAMNTHCLFFKLKYSA